MSISSRQVTFIVVTCDLCREFATEHRSHEAEQIGSMNEFIAKHENRALNSLGPDWVTTKTIGKEKRHICPRCAEAIQRPEKKLSGAQ